MAEALNVQRELSNRIPSGLTQVVLMSLAALEGADNQLLGSSLKYTGPDLGLTLADITQMTVLQGIAANLCAPVWGVMADRRMMRQKDLMICAAIGQGIITILLALATGFGPYMLMLRFFNGAFLAGLRPIANGMIARQTSPQHQGVIFSRVFGAILAGGALCSIIVTPLAGVPMCWPFFGFVRGWRVAWAMVGCMSLLVAAFTTWGIEEEAPPPRDPNETMGKALVEEFGLFCGFFTIPSFIGMVGQGVFGTIPWTVLWLTTRYYQLCGVSDVEAGWLGFANPIGGLIGVIIGGYVSDALVRVFGFHGRPLTAQLTIALGVPVQYINLYAIEPGDGSFLIYLAINLIFGSVASWSQGGCNWPILAQIVPEETRSRVLALESALENSFANALGPIFVNYLATQQFGFELEKVGAEGSNLQAARALGGALTVVVCFPWLGCFIVYSVMHWAVPRDIQRAQVADAQATGGLTREGKAGSQMMAYLASRQGSQMAAGL